MKWFSKIRQIVTSKRYLVSNDTILVVSKFNKFETYEQKITISLTNKKHVLVSNYFYIHLSFIRL